MDSPTFTLKDGKFKILQLTDIHIGGCIFTRKEDKAALDGIKKVVDAVCPDLIAVTGDAVYPMVFYPKPFMSGTFNNLKSSKIFGSFMERLGIPWAMVFGNHDTEIWSRYNRDDLSAYYESLPNCLFRKGECFNNDRGNYDIRVLNENGELNTVLMFLDSNSYLGKTFFSGFDVISDEQINWYKDKINSYKTGDDTPRSLAFFHIPPK